jgi:hypothetical protein
MANWIELSEDERAEAVANALTKAGYNAFAQDTGGGMICVVLERADGGEIARGTADVNCGATITDEGGEQIGSISTTFPSESENIEEIASVIGKESLSKGATWKAA